MNSERSQEIGMFTSEYAVKKLEFNVYNQLIYNLVTMHTVVAHTAYR